MNDALEYLRQIDISSPLLHWVLGSLVAYVVGGHLLWWLRSRNLWRPPHSGLLEEAGRFLFFLGVPYLALGGWPRPPSSGLLSLGDLGLVWWGPRWPATRWLQAVGNGLGLGLAASVVLLVGWANANRSSSQDGQIPRIRFSPRPWWLLLIDVVYLEVHWAFYRGALALLLEDVYRGVFVSLALVYLQWGLNPLWRRGWLQGSQAASRWLRSSLALITALVYLTTSNLWVCLLVHGLIELLFWRLGRKHSAAQPAAQGAEAVDLAGPS